MRIAWMHPDYLRADWFQPDDHAVFVFDDAFLEQAGWGLKRLAFVYETLLELPAEIRHGPVAAVLDELVRQKGASGVVTVDTPDPWIRACFEVLGAEVLPAPSFVELEGRVDLKRFSRYWAKAQDRLF